VALELPPHTDGGQRIEAGLERRGRERLVLASGEENGTQVRAWLGKPEENLPSARGVYLFVNGRFVRDRPLLHALTMGYGELVPHGRYPEAVLQLEVAPDAVDVNVHPQKIEVRFARPQEVYAAVRHCIRQALATSPWARPSEPLPSSMPYVESGRLDRSPTPSMREAVQEYFASLSPTPAVAYGASHVEPVEGDRSYARDATRTPEPSAARVSPSAEPARAMATGLDDSRGYFTTLDYIGQLHRLYLVCQAPGELVLIDQHAAHERVAFERLRRAHDRRAAGGQRLLLPVTIEPGADLVAAAEDAAELLGSCGLDIEPCGPRTLAIRSVPEPLAGCDPALLAHDVLAELADHGAPGGALSDRIDHLFATMACHSVVRAGDALTAEEARALLASMDGVDRRANCPHGRPVLLKLRMEDLARRFERA
jgi:DNA mismatch repair protein MutL